MASDINAKEDRYPWISWAMTGVLTLAVVLAVGLVISAQHPPAREGPQAALPKGTSPARSSAGAPAAASLTGAKVPRTSAVPPVRQLVTAAPEVVPASAAPSDQSGPTSPATPHVAPRQPPKPSLVKTEPPPAESHAVQSPPAVQPAPDAAKRAAYVKVVADVRRAMAQRNLASKRLLKTAADKAQTDSERAEVERLEIIQDHLEQFWDGIRKAVAEMQPTDEIVLSESNRVAVIECSREELVVQWEGKPRRYRIEAMPMELLSAVAKASFKLTPGTKLVVGSFLAVDAHGDRAEARKLWREAIAGGEADGKLLMPELDVPLPKAR